MTRRHTHRRPHRSPPAEGQSALKNRNDHTPHAATRPPSTPTALPRLSRSKNAIDTASRRAAPSSLSTRAQEASRVSQATRSLFA